MWRPFTPGTATTTTTITTPTTVLRLHHHNHHNHYKLQQQQQQLTTTNTVCTTAATSTTSTTTTTPTGVSTALQFVYLLKILGGGFTKTLGILCSPLTGKSCSRPPSPRTHRPLQKALAHVHGTVPGHSMGCVIGLALGFKVTCASTMLPKLGQATKAAPV